LDPSELFDLLRNNSKPAIIGASIAGVLVTVLEAAGYTIPIPKEQILLIGSLTGIFCYWVYGFIYGKFVEPAAKEAANTTKHIQTDEALAAGYYTEEQARITHASIERNRILGIPLDADIGPDFLNAGVDDKSIRSPKEKNPDLSKTAHEPIGKVNPGDDAPQVGSEGVEDYETAEETPTTEDEPGNQTDEVTQEGSAVKDDTSTPSGEVSTSITEDETGGELGNVVQESSTEEEIHDSLSLESIEKGLKKLEKQKADIEQKKKVLLSKLEELPPIKSPVIRRTDDD
jgi:hypothetical protein